ncbi:hypothetical protein [Streptomyces sp. NPDC001594]|uniref:hypothetical protein n=1 Tax=Streptomyces sp. NPDC001594 TaxID=3364590 RepID=UPI0036CF5978
MSYVFVGIGGIEADGWATSHGNERVALPPGTSIAFYADDGDGVLYCSGGHDVVDQLWGPLAFADAEGAVPNLALHGDPAIGEAWISGGTESEDHVLIRPGVGPVPDVLRLCTGAVGECPTTQAEVDAGMTHECQGVLALFAGTDLYWMACTAFIETERPAEGSAWYRYGSDRSSDGGRVERAVGFGSDTTDSADPWRSLSDRSDFSDFSEPSDLPDEAGSGEDPLLRGPDSADAAESGESAGGYPVGP